MIGAGQVRCGVRSVIGLPLVGVWVLGVLAGCASAGRDASDAGVFTGGKRPLSVNFNRAEIALLIRQEYDRTRGIPHRMGGTGTGGFDCSGFSQHVFAKLFGVNLPRTTAVQASIGQRVKRSHLQAGDLVFFKPRSYPRHVGIYVGNGEFVHVSASKGITLSRLDSRYWRRAYWTSRRVIVPTQEI